MNRREFMSGGLVAAVSLIPNGLGTETPNSSKTNAEHLFGRGYELDVENLPKIYLKKDNAVYVPTTEEIKLYSQQVSDHYKAKGKQVLQIKFLGAVSKYVMRVEQDGNYAQRYTKQAKISIEHAQEFFDFPELSNTAVNFVVPKTPEEVIIDDGPLKAYVVAHLIERESLGFQIITDEESAQADVNINKEIAGVSISDERLAAGNGKIDLRRAGKRAIFYSTTAPLESLVCAPIIEFLHSRFHESLYSHLNKKFEGVSGTADIFIKGFHELSDREEKFVHALGILWFEQYNEDRNLGFSGESLKGYFSKRESLNPCYNGMQKLAEHIRKIGVKEARRLYIEEPDKLFEVVEKN